MIPAAGKQLVLGSMGERQVTEVVTQRRHSDRRAPVVADPPLVMDLREHIPDRRMDVLAVCDDIEDPSGQLHHTQRVLKAAMGSPRIDQISQGKLVHVPQSLHGRRVEYCALIAVEADERVNRITDLVLPLHHRVDSTHTRWLRQRGGTNQPADPGARRPRSLPYTQ
jgi:hypothetical protein